MTRIGISFHACARLGFEHRTAGQQHDSLHQLRRRRAGAANGFSHQAASDNHVMIAVSRSDVPGCGRNHFTRDLNGMLRQQEVGDDEREVVTAQAGEQSPTDGARRSTFAQQLSAHRRRLYGCSFR